MTYEPSRKWRQGGTRWKGQKMEPGSEKIEQRSTNRLLIAKSHGGHFPLPILLATCFFLLLRPALFYSSRTHDRPTQHPAQ